MWIRGPASFQAQALRTRVCYAIHCLILLYSTLVLSFLVRPAATDSPSSVYVTLENGSPLYGSYLQSATGKLVSQFLGIPFAEPPVGALRFRKPTAKKAWHEPFNATSQSNACVQSMDTYFGDFQGSTMWNSNVPTSEDCLYLNLWVPDRVDRSKRLAVLVWVYGGGFWSGSATLDVYDGKVLASEENVIVVAMNYRLSVFGFLYLGREEAPGNMGLWDQWLAMKWIHENIGHFGGDNQRITLFGESAGAASVSMHMLSRHSTPYFHRAILQSGSANAPWAVENRQVALHRAVVLYEYMKCGNMSHSNPSEWNTDELLRCMMETSAEKLRMGNKQSADEKAKRKEEKAARKREAKRLQKANKDADSATRQALNLSLAPSRLEETDRSLAASQSRLKSATPATTPSTRLADISSTLSQAMLDSSQRTMKRVVVKTPDELINENRRLRRELLEMEAHVDKLESYIDNLLVKVMQCNPELLVEKRRPDAAPPL